MKEERKEDCCQGFQHGKPACQAKLLVDSIKKAQKEQPIKVKNSTS